MNDPNDSSPQWDELLAGHVLGDLVGEELADFEAASLTAQDQQLLGELETTLARVQLAFQQPNESMPNDLRTKIIRDAVAYIEQEAGPQEDASTSGTTDLVQPASNFQRSAWIGRREVIAWLTCAAALLLAFGFWNAQPNPNVQLSLAEMRSELIASDPDVIQVDWSEGKHPFADPVRGDVVWSTKKQKGFMRFVQMPVNQPTKEQYQLWIIDPARDDEPIDGGVFDISQAGEVIIPIDAKLSVLEPAAFAITIEKPGGVVVSTQERLPLLAAVQKNS
ncbi:anti-sigma factor domain-containing protein [Novipirellula artificiosorum]|uniref:Anti-sigma-K factor rskA n=1 Tax=Novipirellula artificiosorum TaxID=2528016 RepID=A0A5C6D9U2_9BACT|nr:anti-sigma factor [Novipirellula artificiosorum]TWU33903.1 Anti-sigma-K factor rskA [Novipirellula artificiosorum]